MICTFLLLRVFLQASDSRPKDIPLAFVSSLVTHLVSNSGDGFRVYPLCFEELTMWLIKDFAFYFPFANSVTGEYELLALSSRYERPTFAALLRSVRRAVVWFVSLSADFGSILFRGRNKVDLQICRPADGLYIRLSDRTVSRCQTLLRSFTASRPLRRTCDLARPA